MPTVTLFYAGLLGLLMAVLSIRVPMRRGAINAPWGDAGDDILSTRIRVFGNFTEYVPFILVLMMLCEMNGAEGPVLHGLGTALLIVRLIHAVALKAGECALWRKIARAIGAMGTWLILLCLSIMAVNGSV